MKWKCVLIIHGWDVFWYTSELGFDYEVCLRAGSPLARLAFQGWL